MAAIDKHDIGERKTVVVDQDECVECGVCLRSGVCPTDAIYWPELGWPRAIRQAFSAVLIGFKMLEKFGIHGYKGTTTGGGRGTEEMKTNDVTGRYKKGEVGIAAELGRTGVGFRFSDLEKLTMAMSEFGIKFEPENPVTVLIDPETGRIKYREILGEKALSAIVEAKVSSDKAVELLELLKNVVKEMDTVISVDIVSKCEDGEIPIRPMLEEAGIMVRINGKTNIGLGRPLIQ